MNLCYFATEKNFDGQSFGTSDLSECYISQHLLADTSEDFFMNFFFNTAGPCVSEDHYMIDTSERFTNVRELIDQKNTSFFMLLGKPEKPPI